MNGYEPNVDAAPKLVLGVKMLEWYPANRWSHDECCAEGFKN